MKAFMVTTFVVIGILILSLGISFAMQGGDWFMYKFWAPKYEQVRRETFEQSKAYNQGLQQELDSYYLEYAKASTEHKQALASVALHKVADYNIDLLPRHLRNWIQELRGQR